MNELLEQLLIQYPILTKIILVVGILRLLFKPLMAAIQNRVELTASTEDDEKLHRFLTSKTYLVLSFILDLSTSIKLPKLKDK